MRRIPHDVYASVFHIVYLGLMTNVLLVVACLPLLVLLVTTDPVHSWPLLAVAAPVSAPALAAAFAVFREHSRGGTGVARAFWAGLRATWIKALAIGGASTAVLVVLLVDIRALSDSTAGVLIVPVLLVLTVIVAATALVSLVALAEEPGARLRDIVRAAAVLSMRRWYLTAVTLFALAIQAWLFASMPAIAIGITAAAALYLAWANSRYTLRPVLDLESAVA